MPTLDVCLYNRGIPDFLAFASALSAVFSAHLEMASLLSSTIKLSPRATFQHSLVYYASSSWSTSWWCCRLCCCAFPSFYGLRSQISVTVFMRVVGIRQLICGFSERFLVRVLPLPLSQIVGTFLFGRQSFE